VRLEIAEVRVRDIVFAEDTRVSDGVLHVNAGELKELLAQDKRLASVSLELARPGDETRICPVKDVVEPRTKSGDTGVFPGLLGKPATVGLGRTYVLKGTAVVTTGPVIGFQEGIIDMSGPAAPLTPFSATHNVVIVTEPVHGLDRHQYEEAIRLAGLRAARYLGDAAVGVDPSEVRTYEVDTIPGTLIKCPGLPRVAYVYMLQSQGLLHDTYVYGVDAKRILPTLISATEVMDGAIVSGNCVSACDKNTTFHHLNNPVIEDLLGVHRKDLVFAGVIITNENVTLADKERSSDYVANFAERLGVDGAIISKEGFGNPDSDLIMNCRKLEARGIKTVLITDEYAGRDGASQSLADADPVADAVVSAGNANELIELPPMKKTIGRLADVDSLAGGHAGSVVKGGSVTVELQAIIGATNELGFGRLSARGF
jgi:glycine reductase